MIKLRCDNRDLLRNVEYSYLTNNYSSGQSSIQVDNSTDFSADDYILLGNFGSETSEIIKISSVDSPTHKLNLATDTEFAHAESTKVSVIPYNQVKFYQTAAATFDSNENYLGTKDVKADSFFTIYEDTTNITGYGWYVFYNSTTGKASTNSNAMPYSGFEEYSVKEIFDNFYSLLNNNELKLITRDDAFRWLNHSYSIAKNELNLVNKNYNVPDEYSFTVTASDSGRESSLPTNFSDIIRVTDSDGGEIPSISLASKRAWDDDASSGNVRYYLRSSYIGISPVPSSSATYYMYYKKNATTLDSLYDNIDLPDDNYFFLVDGMLARAAVKITRLDRDYHEKKFLEGIQRMKLTSHKRNAQKDSWSIADEANV